MESLKKLEIKKIINNIVFLKEELDLTKSINTTIEKEFHLEVSKLNTIETQPNEKEHHLEVIKIDNTIKEITKKDNSIKKLYREIVKVTHPDKINDLLKNEVYLNATNSYDEDNIIDMIYYIHKLDIDFDYTQLDIESLKTEIENIKLQIKMYESTLHYKWFYNNKDEKILKSYIAKQLISNL